MHNKSTGLQMHQLSKFQRTQSEEHNLRKPHFSRKELPKLARNTGETQKKHRLLKFVVPSTPTQHIPVE